MPAQDWVERLQRHGAGLPLPQCRGLASDERLVVAAIREIVVAGLDAPGAAAVFDAKSGPAGLDALEALRAWLALLAERAARPILVASRCHCCPSPDEVAMLAIIDGARRGDFACAHRLLDGIVRPQSVDAVAHAAEVLGEALSCAGLNLTPRRFSDRP